VVVGGQQPKGEIAMMGRKARHFTPLPAVSLEELVPADHFYRHLERALDKERIHHDQEAMRHGDRGAFGAPTRGEPPILSGEVGVFGARGGLRCFHKGGPQPGAALPGPPTAAFAGALIVARTHARPGSQVDRAGEAGQVDANLGDQHFGGAPAHAGNGLQTTRARRGEAESAMYDRGRKYTPFSTYRPHP
jgi:hypothetical protein